MAYTRWASEPCPDWYVFWHASPTCRPQEELLAIWHCDGGRSDDDKHKCYEYVRVKKMIKSGDLSEIPRYNEKNRQRLSNRHHEKMDE